MFHFIVIIPIILLKEGFFLIIFESDELELVGSSMILV